MTRRFFVTALGAASLLIGTRAATAADAPSKAAGAGTVTLPLSDYDRLIERGRAASRKVEPPPVPAALSQAEARVKVADGLARGTFVVDGEAFRSGPTRVSLVAASTVLEARASGRPLPLVREGGWTSAVVSGSGPFQVTLDWAEPILHEPGRASFPLPAPAAGTVKATLDLPGESLDVRLDGGLVTRKVSAAGRTLLEATLEPGRTAKVSWSAREAQATAAEREARFLSEVRTLVSLGESEVRLTALVEIAVLQGAPRRFTLRLPPGFEVTGLSGHHVDTSQEKDGALEVSLATEAARRSILLLSLERAQSARSFDLDLAPVTVEGAQRETGEIGIESASTLELLAAEAGTLRRMDVREAHASLRSLGHRPLLAAFRYHRRAAEGPKLSLGVRRFDEAPVLAALAERAQVTTLVTAEGRMLTEVALTVRNQAQPFLKVALPAGSTLLSADVAGEAVKPVQGVDGSRVPLLRPGFRPSGPYRVAFSYLHAGSPLGRKGTAEVALPKIDLPVSLLDWELFLPDRYKVRDFTGDALRADLLSTNGGLPVAAARLNVPGGVVGGLVGGLPDVPPAGPGQIVGIVTDEAGGALAGARLVLRQGALRREVVTDAEGRYVVDGLSSGKIDVEASLSGFKDSRRSVRLDASSGQRLDLGLEVGAVTETVTVAAEDATSERDHQKARAEAPPAPPSMNVLNLQRRVAGVLPVRIEVPRQGTSHRFRRALVVDEETTVRFRYQSRKS